MSLQNTSGRLNLYVKDEGTSNVYPHIRTLRFEPEGCLNYGPSALEVTANTAFNTGGAIIVPGDILWELGPGTDSIEAKNAGGIDAGGLNSVAHGLNNRASGPHTYTAGGHDNRINTTANRSICIGGSANRVNPGHTDTVVVGGTNLITAASDTVYACNHIEVGNRTTPTTGSIVRISATGTTTSWEDGNCGNSDYIYFTSSDFIGDNSTQANIRISSNQNLSGEPQGPAFIYASVAGTVFTASKLIPKGFRVLRAPLTNTEFVIYINGGGGLGPGQSVQVDLSEQDISAGSPAANTIGSSSGVITWSGGESTNCSVLNPTSVSDGTLMAIITFHHWAPVLAAWGSRQGLIGVRVPIERQ